MESAEQWYELRVREGGVSGFGVDERKERFERVFRVPPFFCLWFCFAWFI